MWLFLHSYFQTFLTICDVIEPIFARTKLWYIYCYVTYEFDLFDISYIIAITIVMLK